MTERRNRMEIVFDILKSIQDKNGVIKPTHLLYKSNLSHKRMKEYVDELMNKGLMEDVVVKKKKHFAITEDGLKFLAEFRKVREFTDAFGL